MRITGYQLAMMRVPLKTAFITALRRVDCIEDVVLIMHSDDGRIGYGAAPATQAITGDTHASIVQALQQAIMPALLGSDVADLHGGCTRIQTALEKNTNAKAAAEIALFDLFAQSLHAPLYRALGGNLPTLETDLTISVDAIEKMLADVESALALGFRSLKVKLGKDLDQDEQRIRRIHTLVAGRASLRLDANQAWTAEHTIQLMQALEARAMTFDLLEQPLPAHALDGMHAVRECIQTPLLADESVFSPRQALEVIRRQAADILNIKLMKSGGISNALRIADIAAVHDMPCMIGCMLEGAIGVAAAAHVASARAATITRVDLDGPSLATFNPVRGGAEFANSRITLADAPGLGIAGIDGLEPIA